MSAIYTRAEAHELNIDAAYREIDRRALEGEPMDRAYVDQKTAQIKFKPLDAKACA